MTYFDKQLLIRSDLFNRLMATSDVQAGQLCRCAAANTQAALAWQGQAIESIVQLGLQADWVNRQLQAADDKQSQHAPMQKHHTAAMW